MQINSETTLCISIAKKPGNFGANFHNSGYKELNLNWVYLPIKIENSDDLAPVINGVRILNIRGCSVSMPHKETVMPFLDNIDFSARQIGAVNTIVRNKNGDLKGYNTDYYGAKKALAKHKLKGKKVVMIGAGGVAKAVGLAVKDLGGDLIISNRTNSRAKELSKNLNAKTIPLKQLNDLSGYLIINTTSIGMNNPNEMIISEDILFNFNVVMDVVIYPSETKLLRIAKQKEKVLIPGTLMCVYQAAKQFEIYTGIDAPQKIINKSIKAFE